MKAKYVFSIEDMHAALAFWLERQRPGVTVHAVDVTVIKTTVGYGPNEREASLVEATADLEFAPAGTQKLEKK